MAGHVIAVGNYDYATPLFERGMSIDGKDPNGSTALQYVAVLSVAQHDRAERERADVFFREQLRKKNPQISEPQIEQMRKFLLAKSFLTMTYTNKAFPFPVTCEVPFIFKYLMPQLGEKLPKFREFSDLIDKLINREDVALPHGKNLTVMVSNIDCHASYFAIESAALDVVPTAVYYIDGANVFPIPDVDGLCFGAAKYQLEKGLYSDVNGVRGFLSQITTSDYDELKGELEVITMEDEEPATFIPLPKQTRDTCEMKSFTTLLRLLNMLANNRELRLDQGVVSGEGYDAYKEFKYEMIKLCTDIVVTEALDEKSPSCLKAQKFLSEQIAPNVERKVEEQEREETLQLAQYVIEKVNLVLPKSSPKKVSSDHLDHDSRGSGVSA